jgi:hypothetical protein
MLDKGDLMKIRHAMLLLGIAGLAVMALPARGQATAESRNSSPAPAIPATLQVDPFYSRPTQRTKLNNYFFDAFGPYPLIGAALAAGINQADNSPPDWKQGAEGYGKRFGSDFGIAVVNTTTRYLLSEAFKEDALYYRCQCQGIIPRLSHAMTSTLTARRGEDGHHVFSFPALVAPYAGTMTAVYAWYPGRYDAKDALRIGNYSLLWYMGGNIALEFFPLRNHSLLSRLHLRNGHGAPDAGSDQ